MKYAPRKKWTHFLCNFFQYCEESPLELPTCSFEDEGPSYTSLQYYDKWTREKMLLKDDIRCLCPEKYNYLDTRYKFMAKGHYDIVVTNYYCLPVSLTFLLKIVKLSFWNHTSPNFQLMDCNPGEICKEITDLPGEFLVNPKCLCPLDMSCPSLDPQNVETIIFDDHSIVHNVRCEMTSRVSKMRNLGELLIHRKNEEEIFEKK